ncbi:MAG TPA: hypothetical protein VF932_05135, partial [Anaerolineae bacterium]
EIATPTVAVYASRLFLRMECRESAYNGLPGLLVIGLFRLRVAGRAEHILIFQSQGDSDPSYAQHT